MSAALLLAHFTALFLKLHYYIVVFFSVSLLMIPAMFMCDQELKRREHWTRELEHFFCILMSHHVILATVVCVPRMPEYMTMQFSILGSGIISTAYLTLWTYAPTAWEAKIKQLPYVASLIPIVYNFMKFYDHPDSKLRYIFSIILTYMK